MLNKDSLKEFYVTPLKRISHPKGDLFHAMKASEESFVGFGEAYFTTIEFKEVKGWKKHTEMTLNLIVPVGKVKFSIFDETTTNKKVIVLGSDNYGRLTVPPGYWVAFEGMTEGQNIILNLASLEHDPDEAINVDIDSFAYHTDDNSV